MTRDPDPHNDSDIDLAAHFVSATRPNWNGTVESRLDAVHQRSRTIQRRRVLGGTAIAGLLLLGTGTLIVTQNGDDPTVSLRATADVDEPTADKSSDSTINVNPPETATPDVEKLGEENAGVLPMLDDFPLPDLTPLAKFISPDLTDWPAYSEQLALTIEAWVDDLQEWVDTKKEEEENRTELPTSIDVKDIFGPLDAVIAEIVDRLQDLEIGEWKTELDQLGSNLDTWLNELDLTEWTPGFNVDRWLDELDLWLDELDLDWDELDLDWDELDLWLDELDLDWDELDLDWDELDLDWDRTSPLS